MQHPKTKYDTEKTVLSPLLPFYSPCGSYPSLLTQKSGAKVKHVLSAHVIHNGQVPVFIHLKVLHG